MSTISPYVGDGSTKQFDITFEYRSTASIRLRVDGADVPYTFINGSRIQAEVAPPPDSLVEVYRSTPIAEPEVSFTDIQLLHASDLNKATAQPRERVQELEAELYSAFARSFRAPYGEDGMVLPARGDRAGRFLSFDPNGDPIAASGTGEDGGLRVDLAADLGTALVRHKHRLLVDKLGDYVTLDDYAYAGDDASKMEAAFADLGARGGGTLVLPPRPLLFNRKVTWAGSGLHIKGSGHGCTWIVNGQDAAPALQIGIPGAFTYRNAISDIVFGQAAGTSPSVGNCGLLATYQSNLTMSNLQVFQFPSRLHDGIILDRVVQSTINSFGVQEALARGLAITNQSLDIYMTNSRFDGNGTGIEFRDVQGMFFANVTCYGNKVHGLSMVTDFPVAPAQANRYFIFHNVVGDTNGSHNWNIRQLSLAILTSCWGATQLSQTEYTESDGFYLFGDDVEDITFTACIAASNNRHGIGLWKCRSITVDGARLGSGAFPEDWGGDGANNGKGGYGSGLFIGAGSNYSNVRGGHYQSNKDFSVWIANGAQNVTINGVDLRFSQLGQVHNEAAAGQVRITDCPGHNPRGYLLAPAMIGSDVEIINPFDVDCTFYVSGGTVSNIRVNGAGLYNGPGIAMTPPMAVFVPAGAKIAMTYSSAPTWLVIGN